MVTQVPHGQNPLKQHWNIPLKNRVVQKVQAHHGLDKLTVHLPSCVKLHTLPTQACYMCYWKRVNTVNRDLRYQIAVFTTEISCTDANTIKPVKTILSKASYHSLQIRLLCLSFVSKLHAACGAFNERLHDCRNDKFLRHTPNPQTVGVWITSTWFWAAVVLVLHLAREVRTGILSDKFHVRLTNFVDALKCL